MHNARLNTIPVCYVEIVKRKFKVICTCFLGSHLKIMAPKRFRYYIKIKANEDLYHRIRK